MRVRAVWKPPEQWGTTSENIDHFEPISIAPIRTFEWSNPHVVLKVLLKPDGHGKPQEWRVETSAPSILKRFGWRRNSMKAGDRVSVICTPVRDGSPGCRLHTLTLLDSGLILKTKLSTSTDFAPK